MTVGSPDPSDDVQPHPKDTIETILKAMKKPDDFKMDGQTQLKDIGFAKEDFGVLTTYCKNAFNVELAFDSTTQEKLVQSGVVKDLEERVIEAVKHSKKGSVGDS